MLEQIMYIGVLALSCCRGLLARYNWLNYILIALYATTEYIGLIRRGRIALPCMRQFIVICIGVGLWCIYRALRIEYEISIYTHELFLTAIAFVMLFVYYKLDQKRAKPDTMYLLSKYRRTRVSVDSPEDCVICMDLITFTDTTLQCRRCKHKFHKKCLCRWCNESAQCPHCRYEYY